MTFSKLFGRMDLNNVNPGYIRLYKASKDQQNGRLDKSLGVLSILMKSGIQENQIILNNGLADYIRTVDGNFGWITGSAIDFFPINSTLLQPTGYIHLEVRINIQPPTDSIEIYEKVLAYQFKKKFGGIVLTSAMNGIEFNFTNKELEGQDSIKNIQIKLSGYTSNPKYIDSSSNIQINLLNEKGVKIEKYKEPEGKTFEYLTIKQPTLSNYPFEGFDFNSFKNTFSENSKSTRNSSSRRDISPLHLDEFEDEIEYPDAPQITNLKLDFNALGIGGLDSQLNELVRNAVLSRGVKSEVTETLDIKQHTKGILLYGPPGTGKTLIARKISEMLGVKDKYFRVINGPEILNKFVGESERNIRELFELAENNPSKLIVLFFDEVDAIASRRSGGDGAGEKVNNNIVNQMLSKMDGVDGINNVLVIGATNRLDMIDKALLREGRFSIQLHINLPDEKGRKDIFNIQLKKVIDTKVIQDKDPNALIDELVLKTQNFTGAEIKGLCDRARNYALQEVADIEDLSRVDVKKLFIKRSHFLVGLKEVHPIFGQQNSSTDPLLPTMGIPLKSQFQILEKLMNRMNAFRPGQVSSLLITGPKSSGKSTLAGAFADNTKDTFDLTRIITPSILRKSFGEELTQLWLDAQRVKKALIVLDGLENLLGMLNEFKYDESAMRALNNLLGSKTKNQVTVLVTMETDSLELFKVVNRMARWTFSQSMQRLNQLDLLQLMSYHGIKEEMFPNLGPLLLEQPLSMVLDICSDKNAATNTLAEWENRVNQLL